MAEWYELTEEELAEDEDAQLAKQLAHYNTFYATEHGREVLLGLQRECHAMNDPVASVALISLYNRIRSNCGVNTFVEMRAIEAEAKYIDLEEKRD